jgi:hypothetical protein
MFDYAGQLESCWTHRGSVGCRLLMPSHLPDRCLVPRTYSYELAMRTFHYHLHIVD